MADISQLLQWLQNSIGLDKQSIGTASIESHIYQRMEACGIDTIPNYYQYLLSTPDEAEQLIQSVVIPETWFFRDEGAFSAISKHYQKILKTQPHPIRVLSIPCSTGEEPYSVAIQLQEMGLQQNQFSIEAFDISHAVITKAKQGIYREHAFRTDRPRLKEKYFTPTGDNYQLNTDIRQRVNFNTTNILAQPHKYHYLQYHFIFCRNLLIYFDDAARLKTMDVINDLLHPQGLLFLGYAETAIARDYGFIAASQYPKSFAYSKPIANTTPTSIPTPIKLPLKIAPKPSFKRKQNKLTHCLPQETLPTLSEIRQLADTGQLQQALNLCQTYLTVDEYNVEAHFLCAIIYLGLHLTEQSQQAFRKVTYLDPNHYEALYHLALLAEECGDENMAKLMHQRAQRVQKRLK